MSSCEVQNEVGGRPFESFWVNIKGENSHEDVIINYTPPTQEKALIFKWLNEVSKSVSKSFMRYFNCHGIFVHHRTGQIFNLRFMCEKYHEHQKELHCNFIDIKKNCFDRVQQKALWLTIKKHNVSPTSISLIEESYNTSSIVVAA